MQPEIRAYFDDVAKKYGIERQVTFNSVVESACWDEASGTWEVTIRNLKTLQVISRRSRVLISAVGALSIPKSCDIPGAVGFQGAMFHTARWDHSFNWRGKEIVVIGRFTVRTNIATYKEQETDAAQLKSFLSSATETVQSRKRLNSRDKRIGLLNVPTRRTQRL